MRFTRLLAVLLSLYLIGQSAAAQVVAGPMPGHIELRTAKLWVEVKPGTAAELWYWKKGNMASAQKLSAITNITSWYAPVVFDLVGLDMNTTYEYQVLVNNKTNKRPSAADGELTTTDLWQYRKPAPDFSFLTGSCAYFNEPVYDRPGSPYGKDSSIFESMAKEKSSFMLWLGDNWYTREPDFYSDWGLWYRAHRDRGLPILQAFF